MITDIFIQNRAPGDVPVAASQFSRLFLNGDPNDWAITVVGNNPVSLSFTTGVRVKATVFRILNVGNSTAPFVEFQINGFLTTRPSGF